MHQSSGVLFELNHNENCNDGWLHVVSAIAATLSYMPVLQIARFQQMRYWPMVAHGVVTASQFLHYFDVIFVAC